MEAKKTPDAGTRKKTRVWKPEPLAGSEEAKRQAAVILEVLSGVRGSNEGAEVLGISTMRYYVLEARALQGIVKALEPRPKGRRVRSPEDALKQVERDRERYKREVGRLQALLRMVRKSVHLQEPRWREGTRAKGNGRRVRKPTRRVEKVLERLKPAEAGPGPETTVAEA